MIMYVFYEYFDIWMLWRHYVELMNISIHSQFSLDVNFQFTQLGSLHDFCAWYPILQITGAQKYSPLSSHSLQVVDTKGQRRSNMKTPIDMCPGPHSQQKAATFLSDTFPFPLYSVPCSSLWKQSVQAHFLSCTLCAFYSLAQAFSLDTLEHALGRTKVTS